MAPMLLIWWRLWWGSARCSFESKDKKCQRRFALSFSIDALEMSITHWENSWKKITRQYSTLCETQIVLLGLILCVREKYSTAGGKMGWWTWSSEKMVRKTVLPNPGILGFFWDGTFQYFWYRDLRQKFWDPCPTCPRPPCPWRNITMRTDGQQT